VVDADLSGLEAEFNEVERELALPETALNPTKLKELSRRHKELSPIVNTYHLLQAAQEDLSTAKELYLETNDPLEREELRQEIDSIEQKIESLKAELAALMVPKDPNDGRNVIMTIRGAEGGEEANLFAKDLFDMYQKFAERHNWGFEVLSAQVSEKGGFGEVVILISGADAWRRLKHEAGPHRVQRVPVTEASGRIHTSSATVTVLPEIEEVEIDINPNDLKIDVYRSTGPGGQSVNTTDSAVRITHIPTGIVVSMQDERSQIQNRARAMQVLRARLYDLKRQEQEQELAKTRKSQVKSGGRSEKIRTYNFKENRVTDHRINLTLYKLDRVLAGELDEISDALVAHEKTEQLVNL
jgi:peptide chain release factor 1